MHEKRCEIPAERCFSQNHSKVFSSAATPIAGGGLTAANPAFSQNQPVYSPNDG